MELVDIKAFDITYKSYILIKSLNDLHLYYEKYRKPQVFRANDYLKNEEVNSQLGNFGQLLCSIKIGSTDTYKSIRVLANIIGDTYKDQLKYILEGKKLAVNLNGGYFPLPNNAIIKLTKIKDDKIFKQKNLN